MLYQLKPGAGTNQVSQYTETSTTATALPRVTAGGWAPFVRRTFLSGTQRLPQQTVSWQKPIFAHMVNFQTLWNLRPGTRAENSFWRSEASATCCRSILRANIPLIPCLITHHRITKCTITQLFFIHDLKAGPLEAILVIFGRGALIFFCLKALGKKWKWHHFCAHAQRWSPWRRKNVEKGHLAPSNLTFLLFEIDTNGFRRMKEEG